jgi:triacylglycerol esterase/lipase EstA (alpha/beta hydrolase family)
MRETIEALSANGGGHRVALLSHSMGCKIVHYFFNWLQHVAMSPTRAREWVARHVGLWIPVRWEELFLAQRTLLPIYHR